MELISAVCHAPDGGGSGKVGVAQSEIFQVALNLCLVEKLQVGMGSKYLPNAPFQTALGGCILN